MSRPPCHWVHLQVRPRIILKAPESIYYRVGPCRLKRVSLIFVNYTSIKLKFKKEKKKSLVSSSHLGSGVIQQAFLWPLASVGSVLTRPLLLITLVPLQPRSLYLCLLHITQELNRTMQYVCMCRYCNIEEESLHIKVKCLCWMEILN